MQGDVDSPCHFVMLELLTYTDLNIEIEKKWNEVAKRQPQVIMPDAILDDISHRRYNPLKGSWVLVSPHRNKRPWQ